MVDINNIKGISVNVWKKGKIMFGLFLNRTMCDVLDEMRKLNDKLTPMVVEQHKKTFAYLIEELQSMGNRMEAGLSEKGDLETIHEEWQENKRKFKQLEKEIKELEAKKAELQGDLEDES